MSFGPYRGCSLPTEVEEPQDDLAHESPILVDRHHGSLVGQTIGTTQKHETTQHMQ